MANAGQRGRAGESSSDNIEEQRSDEAPHGEHSARDRLLQKKVQRRAAHRHHAGGSAKKEGDGDGAAGAHAAAAKPDLGPFAGTWQSFQETHQSLPDHAPSAGTSDGSKGQLPGLVQGLEAFAAQFQLGMDYLDAGAVKSAGLGAAALWPAVAAAAKNEHGAEADAYLATLARAELAGFGSWSYQGKEIKAPKPDLSDPVTYLRESTAHAERAVEVAAKVFQLAAKVAKAGFTSHVSDDEWEAARGQGGHQTANDADDAQALASAMALLTQRKETAFVWAVVVAMEPKQARAVQAVLADTGEIGQVAQGNHKAQIDEEATSLGYTGKVASPDMQAKWQDAEDKIVSLISDDNATAVLYVSVLKQFSPEDRTGLLIRIQQRGQLDNMMSLGGDDVIDLVQETPRFTGHTLHQENVTAHNTLQDMGRELPGAALSFGAGVYDGMSHIPVVGGVFKDAANDIRDVRTVVDDHYHANKNDLAVRDTVASTAGTVDEGLGMYGAGKAFEAGAAADSVAVATGLQDADEARKTVSALDDLGRFILSLKQSYEDAKNSFDLAKVVKANLLGGLGHLTTLLSSPEPKAEDLIDAVDEMFDAGLDVLKDKVGAKYTEKGAEEARKNDPSHRDEIRKKAAFSTATTTAVNDFQAAQTAAQNNPDQAGNAMSTQFDADRRMKQSGTQDLAAIQADPDRIAKNEKAIRDQEDEDEKAEKKRIAAGKSIVERAKEGLVEVFKQALIDGLFWGLTKAKDALVERIKAWASGKRKEGLGIQELLSEVLSGVAGRAVKEVVHTLVTETLPDWISDHVLDALLEDFPDLKEGLKEPVTELLAWVESESGLDTFVEGEIGDVLSKIGLTPTSDAAPAAAGGE